MDYVHVSNTTLDSYSQTDTACTGAEANWWSCIHGGEKLQVPVPSLSSCTGVTATDSLGAFNWTCQVKSGQAMIYSVGLQDKKGLKDIINLNGFLSNAVTVTQNNCPIAQTPSSKWWNNTFIPLYGAYDNHISGSGLVILNDSSGTIYTLDVSRATDGYNLNKDKQAIVMLSGVTLQYTGNAVDNIQDAAGKPGANNSTVIVSAGSQKFQWIEGVFNGSPSAGTTASQDVLTRTESFLVYRASIFDSSTGGGLFSWACQSCLYKSLTGLNCTNGAGAAIFDDAGTGGFFQDLYAYDNVGGGVDTSGTSSYIQNVFTANNTNGGFDASGSSSTFINIQSRNDGTTGLLFDGNNNIFVQTSSANTFDYGTRAFATTNSTYLGVTATNTGADGIAVVSGAANNTFVNIATSNSPVGITIDNSNNNLFYQVATTDNGYGIQASTGSTGNNFQSYVLIGNNSTKNCYLNAAGASPGFVDPTCTSGGGTGAGTYGSGGSTANWGGGGNLSTAILYSGMTLGSSFVGKVTTTDTANGTNVLGLEAYASITDWFNFSYVMRGWGLDGGAFPSGTNQGQCSGGNCRIWDWRLSKNDTVLRNTTLNGASQNGAFVPGSTCPPAVHGNTAIIDQWGHTFLPNAMEITFDFVHNPNGNNNGLCESNEACIYMPNIGAYQGEGDPFSQSPCVFQNGTVSNVIMYAYPQNGG